MPDRAIDVLRTVPGLTGGYVAGFINRNIDDRSWLDQWFRQRALEHYETSEGVELQFESFDPEMSGGRTTSPRSGARLASLTVSYFRGIKSLPNPIDLVGDLVVFEGRNSSGKTSLAEAIEFLFTGGISRREQLGKQNAREFEKCVGHRLRPPEESTWVEATFIVGQSKTNREITIRRKLIEDYGIKADSMCESVLLLDGNTLAKEEEDALLESLVHGKTPILTQHALRDFIHSPPSQRREFFESLLQLEELTRLIEISVVTDERLPEFVSPNCSDGLKCWDKLGELLSCLDDHSAKQAWDQCSGRKAVTVQAVQSDLSLIARHAFDLPEGTAQLSQVIDWAKLEQRKAVQRSFPLLDRLKPSLKYLYGKNEGENQEAPEVDFEKLREELTKIWETYSGAESAAKSLAESNRAIHRALQSLSAAGLIDSFPELQLCPLCEHESPMTLTKNRIREIGSWSLSEDLVEESRRQLNEKMDELHAPLKRMIATTNSLVPNTPDDEEIRANAASLDSRVRKIAISLVTTRSKAHSSLQPNLEKANLLLEVRAEEFSSTEECQEHVSEVISCLESNVRLEEHARVYAGKVEELESAVLTQASQDPEFQRRAAWLRCTDSMDLIKGDFRWEQCKRKVQNELTCVRDQLMKFRTDYLESRRSQFNDGLHEAWGKLREDTYSKFSELRIPRPSGRGFPVRMEVKAILNDGKSEQEVDALSVFSESQANALGLAAFVTRAELSGHGMIVLDDPVQSMDEEHFKTFARELLPKLLGKGFQVIILTHSDLFARDISFHHSSRAGYVTLLTKQSRRHGCRVEEGNRTIPERLKTAERRADEGDLKEAWTTIRLAIERLYMLTYQKHGPNTFDHRSWRNHSAENIWNEGVQEVFARLAPGADVHLKEMLEMTAGGAHDKPERGYTDVKQSIKYVRSLPNKLNIGG